MASTLAPGNEPPTIDRDLVGKLLSAGFTILGIGFPVMTAALAALRDPGLSDLAERGLRSLVWALLPAVVICAVQSMLCLGTLSGLIKQHRAAVLATLMLLVYMMVVVVGWALLALLG